MIFRLYLLRGRLGFVDLLKKALNDERNKFLLQSGNGKGRSKLSVFYDETGRPHSFLYSDYKKIYRFVIPENVSFFLQINFLTIFFTFLVYLLVLLRV